MEKTTRFPAAGMDGSPINSETLDLEASAPGSSKILWSIDEICEHLSGQTAERITIARFYMLVRLGLPGLLIGGRWCAHADNLDKFMKELTSIPMRKQQNKPEDDE